MEIDTSITLDPGVEYSLSPEQAASEVLSAIGGKRGDTSNVTIVRRPESTRTSGMSIQTIVTLIYGDQPQHDAPGAAQAVLAALNGDETKDYIDVRFNLSEPLGSVGILR